MDQTNFIELFLHASVIVQAVLIILLLASILSWTFIFQRAFFLRRATKRLRIFESEFWSGIDLGQLYDRMRTEVASDGLASIFKSGFQEFARLSRQENIAADAIMEGTNRAMRIALSKETDKLENHLPILATIGSVSPYIGLFGTVWGIMSSFQALGAVEQATLSMVAPGISEALVATAIGLFAAIPAVIGYNRFTNRVDRLLSHYDNFQEEFASILHREAYARLKKNDNEAPEE
ncbi:protein TolQ [Piscirickettsia salmonis]|uniref:protein TolQ n=1 Tax=Piscirickettsia salmonis TaxID=1238 RepID=UPI0007C8AAD3|nr:Biopolymer transport protein ExbB [Piscirickettsiaceae bacterium NZ-RLO1]